LRYLAASRAAKAQYAEALFDMCIAYPRELWDIYDQVFPEDVDRFVMRRVRQLINRSASAPHLAFELAGLATVPCDSFRQLAEQLTSSCRSGLGAHQMLCAVLDLVEVSRDYERAMAEARKAHVQGPLPARAAGRTLEC